MEVLLNIIFGEVGFICFPIPIFVFNAFVFNNFLQALLLNNQRDQVPLFRYNNQNEEVSHFFE